MKMKITGLMILMAMLALLLGGCENPAADAGPVFSVSYDGNYATSGTSPDKQTKTENSEISIAANTNSLERTGFVFSGWNASANGSGTDYPVDTVYAADADLVLYAKWMIAPVGGSGDFELNGSWNLGTTSVIFSDLVFSNSTASITADFPDVVYSYDNTANTAILFWTYNNTFAKIDWTVEGTGFKVHHSEEVHNLNLLDAAANAFDYNIYTKYTVSPTVVSMVPASGSTVPRTTNRIEITFSHIMNTNYVSISPTGAIVAAEPDTVWQHNYVTGQSTLALENVEFSTTVGSVSIQLYSSMRDCNGNSLVPVTISFTTTN